MTRAKKSDYGQYTIYQDPYGNNIGRQVDAAGAGSFTRMQNCMQVCEDDRQCAGIVLQSMVKTGTVNTVGPKSCKLIYGDTQPGQYKRTVVRMDPTRLEIPVYLRGGRDSALLRGLQLVVGNQVSSHVMSRGFSFTRVS